MDEKERLKQILLEKSYKEGTFTLTSGKKSDFYIDCKQTTLSAEGAYLCGKLLYKLIRQQPDLTAVGGMTLGADPLVTAVSIVSFLEGSPMPAFIIRKEPKGHGTGSWIEGKSNIQAGSFVALVEDVVTTGGTLIKAIERTQVEGYKVGGVFALVDREEGGSELLAQHGFKLVSIFTRSELLS
ncbi:MAG: orotate phosphoribosyltransferase [Thermodesulfobacteria bacterium]|nr:orotate phosphoribosyltransferase [Thermodesulfobacteriota bacterium]